jgi:hypothetical protein
VTYESRLVAPTESPSAPPPRLVVGAAGDRHEALADRAAATVVASWGHRTAPVAALGWGSADGGPVIHRQTGRVGADGGALDAAASRDIDAARSGGTPLEAATRSLMEGAFGADLSTVRVHADGRAGALCDRVRAQAFTIGADIFFRRGRPDTSQPAGRHLLAHELAHVVQRSSPHAVRRTYLDGRHDWMADSRHTDGPTGPEKPRSAEMLAVDAEVANTRLVYPSATCPCSRAS